MMEAPATTAPPAPDSSNLEKQQKAAAAQQKRAKSVAASLREFLAAWHRATAAVAAAAAAAVPAPAGKQQAKGKQGRAPTAAAKGKPPAAGSKSKKAGPKDPKDEALAKLMQDLDEKVNKAKKCKLEDMYNAVAALDAKEQQVLSSILSAYGSKLLGEKGGNEASMSLRDALCAAAAAHSYRCPQSPEASKSSAATFRQQGLPACSMLEAGFTARQLLRGGYSTAELVQSGVPLAKLRAAGISVAELYSHLPADAAAELSGVAGAAALRAAGYTAAAVQEGAAAGALSSWDLKLAGYPVSIASSSPAPAVAAGGSNLSPRSRFSLPAGVLKQQPERPSQQDGSGQSEVQYFRHQIVPLVQMQPGVDVPPLLLSSSAQAPPPSSQSPAAAASPARRTARMSSSVSSSSRVPRIKWQTPAAEASAAATPHKQQQQEEEVEVEGAAAEDREAVAGM